MPYPSEKPGKNPGFTSTFAPLPNWLLLRKEISPTAKVIYGRLLQYKGKKDHAYPGRRELADECGLDIQAADRAIRELKKFGLILVKRRGHTRANMYTFPLHEWMSNSKGYKPLPTIPDDKPNLATHDASDLSNLTTHPHCELSPVIVHDLSPVITQYEKITEKIIVEEKRDFSAATGKNCEGWFEEFWGEYPLKRHKKLTSTHFMAAMGVTTFAHLMGKVRAYKRMVHHKGAEEFFISSHKWLQEERWNDCYGEFEKEAPTAIEPPFTPPVPPGRYKGSWEAISAKLKERKGEAIHKSWFGKICLGGVEGGTATIHVATNFVKTWNETHFKDDILCAVQLVYPQVTRLEFLVC